MKNTFIKKNGMILLTCMMTPSVLFAHGERTEGSGGHKDNKNKSGLSFYHYHCGGYPAHLHTNGCPYDSSSNVSYSSLSSSSSTTSISTKAVAKPTYQSIVAQFNIDGNNVEIKGIIDNGAILVEMRP